MKKRMFTALTALTALALLVSGCSSSDTGGGSGSGSSSEIVIGGVFASNVPEVRQSFEAWVKMVNADGGVDGHMIKLIAKDTGNADGLQIVKDMVEKDKITAIVADGDNGDSTWAKYVSSKGIPVIGGNPTSIPFLTNPDFFPIGANLFAVAYGSVAMAKVNGDKLGTLYCANYPSCAQIPTLYQGLAKPLGVDVSVSAKVDIAASDFTAACQQLIDAAPDSVFLGVGAVDAANIFEACSEQGLESKVVAVDGTLDGSWTKIPGMEGMRAAEAVAPFTDDSVPATKAYQDFVAKYLPDLGERNGPTAFYSYISGELFRKAIENSDADIVTSQSIKDGLYKMKDETLGGLTPPLTFVKDKPTMVNCYFTLGIDGGKYTSPNGLKTECAPDELVTGILASMG